jgi:hypothetical protein
MKRIAAALWLSASLGMLDASSPTAWELNTYRDFVAGRFTGLSLTRDGRLTLAPRTETLFASEQPIVWAVVAAPDGTLYASTGHRGRVYRIDSAAKASLVWTSDQPEVFALALDPKGVLYAATSPDGRIYRIENGKATEYFAPGARYIWSLAFSTDGTLYAGTGDQGRIFRITGPGRGEVYYETGQAHVTCLALDNQGRLLAGSEPNGILYRVSAKDKGFVLYDANLPEIRAIVPAPDGTVYAAALGGSLSRRALGGVSSQQGVPPSASVPTTTASITVEAQGGAELRPKPEAPKGAATAQAPAAAAMPATAAVDLTGVEKSAIYQIGSDNTVETLWSSKEENVYDLLLAGRQLVFSTDAQGRIYRLGTDRQATLVTQTNEGEATRLLSTASGLVAATGDAGKLFRLSEQNSPTGSYESPVHDANTVARWGRLSWRGANTAGGKLVFRTRSGNSFRPDTTWSDWSEPLSESAGSTVSSPNARYIQWKADFSGSSGSSPELDSATLAYLPQNTPPVVKSINVATVLSPAAAAARAAAQAAQASSAYSVTVTDSGDAAPTTSSGTATQNLSRPGSDQLQMTWQAEDPDGDRLVYSVWFRGEDQREWIPLKTNLAENTLTLDSDALADGKYLLKVIASDSPANPPSTAREAEQISPPVLVDHTPPLVTAGAPKRTGSKVEIEFNAVDAASPLRSCGYSLDAGPWVPMDPVEGILDSARERFLLSLDNLKPGEHLVVVRAIDAANNAGLARVVVSEPRP